MDNQMKVNEMESDIEKIVICYENGETKEIEKGFVSTFREEDNEVKIDNEFSKISGEEFLLIMRGFTEAYIRIMGNGDE